MLSITFCRLAVSVAVLTSPWNFWDTVVGLTNMTQRLIIVTFNMFELLFTVPTVVRSTEERFRGKNNIKMLATMP